MRLYEMVMLPQRKYYEYNMAIPYGIKNNNINI
jgi:hypothetical protein